MSGDNRLDGMYRLKSVEVKKNDTGEPVTGFGEKPAGFISFSHNCMSAILTADKRLRRHDDKINMFNSVIAYGGTFYLEKDKITVQVETSWYEGWVGKTQERQVKTEGSLLVLLAIAIPAPWDAKDIIDAVLTWEKIS